VAITLTVVTQQKDYSRS